MEDAASRSRGDRAARRRGRHALWRSEEAGESSEADRDRHCASSRSRSTSAADFLRQRLGPSARPELEARARPAHPGARHRRALPAVAGCPPRRRERDIGLGGRAPARRSALGERTRGLRTTLVPLAQTAGAAGAAWALAHDVIGHRTPFFAPVAATIVLGLGPGRRGPRAVEMVLGVAVGIGIGDLLIAAIGSGAGQIALVVLLAMAAAVLLGGGPLVASQAASSAVLVAALPTASSTASRPASSRRARRRQRRARGARRRPAQPAYRRRAHDRPPLRRARTRPRRDRRRPRAAGCRGCRARARARPGSRCLDDALPRRARAGAGDGTPGAELLAGSGRDRPLRGRVPLRRLRPAQRARAGARRPHGARAGGVLLRRTPPRRAHARGRRARARPGARRTLSGSSAAMETLFDATGEASVELDSAPPLPVTVMVAQVRSTVVDLLRALGVDRADAVRHVRASARERRAQARTATGPGASLPPAPGSASHRG